MDPPAPRHAALAQAVAVGTAVLAIAAVALAVVQPVQEGRAASIIAAVAAAAAFGPIGALIVRRRGNAVGWALLGIGAGLALNMFTTQYGIVAATHRLALPGWQLLVLMGLMVFVLTAGTVALLLLFFPTGSLPTPRWGVVLWAGLAGVVGSALLAVVSPARVEITESAAVSFQNPLGIEGLRGAITILQPIAGVVAVASGLACIASIVVRFRRGSPDDRERIKWLAYVAVSAVLFLFVGEVLSSAAGCQPACGNAVWYVFFAGVSLGVPAAVGMAILRHGLYDIEVVIRKTVVVGTLAVFFITVYALVVGGVGALVQRASSTTLSFAAAALVAVLSQPVLARARRFADLVVYGRRATPYEVLAEFSGVMAGTRSNEVVLNELARVLGEGAGARHAEVWLRLGPDLHIAAAWPGPVGDPARAVPLTGGPGPELPPLEADVAVPVRHNEALLGALSVSMPASEPATPATRTLLADLAGQAGLVLRNVQLIEDLRASRRRLVKAQDEERRRLERNLHDGAQQQLIALKLRLRLAEGMAGEEQPILRQALAELGDAAQDALDDLRDLARGIYPPLLAERGLAAALDAQARRSPIDVRVQPAEIARYAPEAEAAVYFCSLEALQNVAKYARATSATVRLWQENGALSFAVSDDGRGFDTAQVGYGTGLQGMADRLSALGGLLVVESEPGVGTTVRGRLPVDTPESGQPAESSAPTPAQTATTTLPGA